MKHFRIVCMTALFFMVCSAFSFPFLKAPSNKVYAFGVAASFKDTIVYFTDIQVLDSVKLTSKGFLPNRSGYSYELKEYMEKGLGQEHCTCMIYFSKNKEKLQKQEAKLRKIYRKNGDLTIRNIRISDFLFSKPTDADTETIE